MTARLIFLPDDGDNAIERDGEVRGREPIVKDEVDRFVPQGVGVIASAPSCRPAAAEVADV